MNFDVARINLKKNQVVSFHSTLGPAYWYMTSNIGQNPTQLKGRVIDEPADVSRFFMRTRTSSDSDKLSFKVWVIRQGDEIEIFKSDVFTPLSKGPVDISFGLDMSFEPGELLTIAFERIGTSGSSTYYLYPDSISIRMRGI